MAVVQAKVRASVTENPLAGGSFTNWLELWRRSGGVDQRYWLRALYITAVTAGFAPLRLLQTLRFERRIRATRVRQAPLFILGHYRSGTTYLQNLLVQDGQWGFVSTAQAVVPGAFLLGPGVSRVLGVMLSESRPMDNVAQSPSLPEEPEHAIGNLSPYCFYHGLCFPRLMIEYFSKYVLFEGIDPREKAAWMATYRRVLGAATLASRGRPLVVKNPPDSARIGTILEMYPGARFVHIYRNPFVMYPSIKNFYTACIRDWQLQSISEAELHENILTIYAKMMRAYERDKALIAQGRLVEIRFEDLEGDPLGQLERVYTGLGLPGFDQARDAFRTYADAQAKYRKNRYRLSAQTIAEIRERWGDQVERWDYEPPRDLLSA